MWTSIRYFYSDYTSGELQHFSSPDPNCITGKGTRHVLLQPKRLVPFTLISRSVSSHPKFLLKAGFWSTGVIITYFWQLTPSPTALLVFFRTRGSRTESPASLIPFCSSLSLQKRKCIIWGFEPAWLCLDVPSCCYLHLGNKAPVNPNWTWKSSCFQIQKISETTVIHGLQMPRQHLQGQSRICEHLNSEGRRWLV